MFELVPVVCLIKPGKIFSSPAAVTLLWLDNIRSTKVVPVRGKPIIKIGSSLSTVSSESDELSIAGAKPLAPVAVDMAASNSRS